jgi:hypothetical protein
MTIQQTTNLTNSIRVQYVADYLGSAMVQRLYDQLAVPVPGMSMEQAIRGSSVQVPFLSGMQPSTSVISQTADLTPQILRDAVASITPTSRADVLQWSEAVDIQTYTDYGQKRFKVLGQNMMESIELLAIEAAVTGSWVERTVARASLDAGEATHRASDALFRKYYAKMLAMRIPGFINSQGEANTWSAIMTPEVFNDICESGNVNDIGLYQNEGIHLNFELAKLGPFRLVVSPFAKVFGSAGVDNGTAVGTTLASAANRLATTIVTAGDVSANIAAGSLWTIGTEETAGTMYPTNERVKVISADTTTLTIIGEGENGGLRFDHAAGEAVRNADHVYTITFGGPGSLVKLYAPEVGEFGETVGPKKDGLVEQWAHIGWKFYGGYGRLRENSLLRYECSSSADA